jgi:hypothetical protein
MRVVVIAVLLVVLALALSALFVDMRIVGREMRPIHDGIQNCVRYRTLYGSIEETCTPNPRCFDAHVGDRLPSTCR